MRKQAFVIVGLVSASVGVPHNIPEPVKLHATLDLVRPALALVEDMRNKIANVNIAYYVNVQTIRAIEQALGTKILSNAQQYDNDDDDDGIIDETDRYN